MKTTRRTLWRCWKLRHGSCDPLTVRSDRVDRKPFIYRVLQGSPWRNWAERNRDLVGKLLDPRFSWEHTLVGFEGARSASAAYPVAQRNPTGAPSSRIGRRSFFVPDVHSVGAAPSRSFASKSDTPISCALRSMSGQSSAAPCTSTTVPASSSWRMEPPLRTHSSFERLVLAKSGRSGFPTTTPR